MSPIIKKSVSFNGRPTSGRAHMGAICKLFPLDLHWVHSPVCIDMEYMCKQCLADQAVSGLRSVPGRGRYTPPSTATLALPQCYPSTATLAKNNVDFFCFKNGILVMHWYVAVFGNTRPLVLLITNH